MVRARDIEQLAIEAESVGELHSSHRRYLVVFFGRYVVVSQSACVLSTAAAQSSSDERLSFARIWYPKII